MYICVCVLLKHRTFYRNEGIGKVFGKTHSYRPHTLDLGFNNQVFYLGRNCHSSCCSATKSYLTLCDPMDCSSLGSSVLHYLKLVSICQCCYLIISSSVTPFKYPGLFFRSMLRTTRERMLGADAVLDLDGVLVPGVVLQTSFGNDVSRAGKKKKKWRLYCNPCFCTIVGSTHHRPGYFSL